MATIELYLIRHGLAADRDDEYPDDAKRPLTPEGVSRLRREARGLQSLGVAFDQILTSPLVRAKQTAEVFAQAQDAKVPTAQIEALAPGGTPAQVVQALAEYAQRRAIALVGHEPNMSELTAKLLGTRTPVPFKKGAICCIEFEALPPARPGTLAWFATPRMLRKLGT
jgi:phosphohistidine phosphatase